MACPTLAQGSDVIRWEDYQGMVGSGSWCSDSQSWDDFRGRRGGEKISVGGWRLDEGGLAWIEGKFGLVSVQSYYECLG
jgi:hypothetical protein